MANFEIKSYIKLLCIRLDHFESYVVDEVNTTDEETIKKFIDTHKNRKGTKILLFEMNTMDMITLDEIQNIIHNAHVSVEYMKNASISSFIKYMLEAK